MMKDLDISLGDPFDSFDDEAVKRFEAALRARQEDPFGHKTELMSFLGISDDGVPADVLSGKARIITDDTPSLLLPKVDKPRLGLEHQHQDHIEPLENPPLDIWPRQY